MLAENFEQPNPEDSFRSLIEQVLEDVLVGGYRRDRARPDRRCERPADVVASGWREHPDSHGLGRQSGVAAICAGDRKVLRRRRDHAGG